LSCVQWRLCNLDFLNFQSLLLYKFAREVFYVGMALLELQAVAGQCSDLVVSFVEDYSDCYLVTTGSVSQFSELRLLIESCLKLEDDGYQLFARSRLDPT